MPHLPHLFLRRTLHARGGLSVNLVVFILRRLARVGPNADLVGQVGHCRWGLVVWWGRGGAEVGQKRKEVRTNSLLNLPSTLAFALPHRVDTGGAA